jgi:ribosomal protein L39E
LKKQKHKNKFNNKTLNNKNKMTKKLKKSRKVPNQKIITKL